MSSLSNTKTVHTHKGGRIILKWFQALHFQLAKNNISHVEMLHGKSVWSNIAHQITRNLGMYVYV